MAKKLQDLQLKWREKLTKARASALLLRLADSLFESPLVTIPQAQRVLGVTYRTAQQNVERLVEEDILQQESKTSYGKTFSARDILNLISENPR
jgi:Fic family protein